MIGSQRAIVASDSNLARDPRVLKQVRWLVDSGWIVDSVGRGEHPPEVNGAHFTMPPRSFLLRAFGNMLLPRRLRYWLLVESTIPKSLREQSRSGKYDLAVLNEIELLPWFSGARDDLVKPSRTGRVHVDLHEYAPSQRSGLLHRLFFRKYREWQTGFVTWEGITSRSVVSPGVASLYSEHFSIPAPVVIRNIPDFVDQSPRRVDSENIKLVYHGSAAPMRRVDLVIAAMAEVHTRFSLHLMLVGSRKWIEPLKAQASSLAGRVTFLPPVDVRRVASALNGFDVEVIFTPPETENIRHGLPNKLFEAVQGRLGIVTGQAPDKAELVSSYGIGVVVDGWAPSDLARTINALTVAEIDRMKLAAHRAAQELSAQSERLRFLDAVGIS